MFHKYLDSHANRNQAISVACELETCPNRFQGALVTRSQGSDAVDASWIDHAGRMLRIYEFRRIATIAATTESGAVRYGRNQSICLPWFQGLMLPWFLEALAG